MTKLHVSSGGGTGFPFQYLFTNMSVQNKTAEKILSFADLENGWHYGQGKAPSLNLIKTVLLVLKEMNRAGFVSTDVFPGIDDEILLVAYSNSKEIEVLCKYEQNFDVCIEENNVEVDEKENISWNELSELISIRGFEWIESSDSFTKNTMMKGKNVSVVSHSRTLPTMEASLLSPWSASNQPMQQIAITSENIINPEFQVNRRSTGSFRAA